MQSHCSVEIMYADDLVILIVAGRYFKGHCVREAWAEDERGEDRSYVGWKTGYNEESE